MTKVPRLKMDTVMDRHLIMDATKRVKLQPSVHNFQKTFLPVTQHSNALNRRLANEANLPKNVHYFGPCAVLILQEMTRYRS